MKRLRRRASALRGFCRWLFDQGIVKTDPWSGATLSLGRARRLPRALPAHELERLIEFLKGAARIERRGVPDPNLIGERWPVRPLRHDAARVPFSFRGRPR